MVWESYSICLALSAHHLQDTCLLIHHAHPVPISSLGTAYAKPVLTKRYWLALWLIPSNPLSNLLDHISVCICVSAEYAIVHNGRSKKATPSCHFLRVSGDYVPGTMQVLIHQDKLHPTFLCFMIHDVICALLSSNVVGHKSCDMCCHNLIGNPQISHITKKIIVSIWNIFQGMWHTFLSLHN